MFNDWPEGDRAAAQAAGRVLAAQRAAEEAVPAGRRMPGAAAG
jgi:hypothetical protein